MDYIEQKANLALTKNTFAELIENDNFFLKTLILLMQHIRPVDYQCFINKMVEKSVLHFFFFAERVQN